MDAPADQVWLTGSRQMCNLKSWLRMRVGAHLSTGIASAYQICLLIRTVCSHANLPIAWGRVIFVDGPGGTGKTFLYTLLLASVRAQGKVALAAASSCIAALLMEGGRTAHSRFKLPVPANETSTCRCTLLLE